VFGDSSDSHARSSVQPDTRARERREQGEGRGVDLQKVLSQSEERWNKHDAEALAALQAEDIDHINTSGGWSKGREDIRKLWAQLFETRLKEVITEVKLEKIRFLKPDVAVAIVRIFHKRPAEDT
jgi:uncharacterized protein (TIGR02246 family)